MFANALLKINSKEVILFHHNRWQHGELLYLSAWRECAFATEKHKKQQF